jgi:hypothetical protein
VLVDLKVELRQPFSARAMAATTKVCGSSFLKLHGVSPGRAFIGHTPSVEHKDSVAKSISNLSLEAMIPLGFVKGKIPNSVLLSRFQVENEFVSVTWATRLVRFLVCGTGIELSVTEGDRWCAASSDRGAGLGPGYRVTGLAPGFDTGLAVLAGVGYEGGRE